MHTYICTLATYTNTYIQHKHEVTRINNTKLYNQIFQYIKSDLFQRQIVQDFLTVNTLTKARQLACRHCHHYLRYHQRVKVLPRNYVYCTCPGALVLRNPALMDFLRPLPCFCLASILALSPTNRQNLPFDCHS